MFEVECPDCRHIFDVEDDEQTARCPVCTLELDLLEPGESTPADALEQEEPFDESPCPYCGGPLLIAASDESGLCAHCERPLVFQDQKALPFPGASAVQDEPDVAEVASVYNSVPLSGFFDPALEVTSENAPLVECAPVASKQSDDAMEQTVQNEAAGPSSQASTGERAADGAKRSKSKKTPDKSKRRSGRKANRKKAAQGKQANKSQTSRRRSAAGKRTSVSSGGSRKRAKSAAKKTRGGRN